MSLSKPCSEIGLSLLIFSTVGFLKNDGVVNNVIIMLAVIIKIGIA